jgi:hypothetical protein
VHIGIAKLPTLQVCLSVKHCHLLLRHAESRLTLEASHYNAIDQLWQERVGLYEKENLFPIRDAAYQDWAVILWLDFLAVIKRGGLQTFAVRPSYLLPTKIEFYCTFPAK